jgi:MATE family multidrug resistance protein
MQIGKKSSSMNERNSTNFLKKEIYATLKLALPVIIGQLGHIMMGVEDSLMVGHMGAVPLAASSLANGLFFLVLVVGLGITIAVTPLVAKEVGAQRDKNCGKVLQQGIRLSIISAFVLAGVVLLVSLLIQYMNSPHDVAVEAKSYLQILGISIFPVMIFQAYRQFSEGLSLMWPVMVITLVANGFNIFLNWIFIYGNLGFPELGLMGAGFSTFGTRIFMAAVMIWYILTSRNYRKYLSTGWLGALNWPFFRSLVKIGTASGFQYFFESSSFSGAAIMIGWLGANSLAAHQIASQECHCRTEYPGLYRIAIR